MKFVSNRYLLLFIFLILWNKYFFLKIYNIYIVGILDLFNIIIVLSLEFCIKFIDKIILVNFYVVWLVYKNLNL